MVDLFFGSRPLFSFAGGFAASAAAAAAAAAATVASASSAAAFVAAAFVGAAAVVAAAAFSIDQGLTLVRQLDVSTFVGYWVIESSSVTETAQFEMRSGRV